MFFVTIVKKEFSDIFLIYPPQLSNLEHNYLGICSLQLNRQLILFLREAAIRTVDFDECTFEQNNKNQTCYLFFKLALEQRPKNLIFRQHRKYFLFMFSIKRNSNFVTECSQREKKPAVLNQLVDKHEPAQSLTTKISTSKFDKKNKVKWGFGYLVVYGEVSEVYREWKK